jgi:hypothetical protein
MTVDVELIRRVIDTNGLDYLEVWDQGGRSLIFDADGSGMDEALDELPAMLSGSFRVRAGKESEKGQKGAKVYTWVCVWNGGAGASRGIGSVNAGPGWQEFMQLQLDLQEQRLRQELEPKDGDAIDRIAALFAQVNGAPAPRPAGPAPVDKGTDQDADALPAEVLQAVRDVATLYERNPDAFRTYAPMLHNLANRDE